MHFNSRRGNFDGICGKRIFEGDRIFGIESCDYVIYKGKEINYKLKYESSDDWGVDEWSLSLRRFK